ncbi:MAG: hypothetical protein NTZ18_01650 [Candidatus Komeilibacteria bacterium]|nr:hypothetical protein [Candidatus Komeilibacteria bacterium]
MIFQISKTSIVTNLRDILRKCGYFGLADRFSGQISYVKRLSQSQYYPRFHLYFTETEDNFNFKLHLDQKKPSYQGSTAHSGEYNDPIVAEETDRIKNIINNL